MACVDVEDGMITKLSVQAIFFGSPTIGYPKIVNYSQHLATESTNKEEHC